MMNKIDALVSDLIDQPFYDDILIIYDNAKQINIIDKSSTSGSFTHTGVFKILVNSDLDYWIKFDKSLEKCILVVYEL